MQTLCLKSPNVNSSQMARKNDPRWVKGRHFHINYYMSRCSRTVAWSRARPNWSFSSRFQQISPRKTLKNYLKSPYPTVPHNPLPLSTLHSQNAFSKHTQYAYWVFTDFLNLESCILHQNTLISINRQVQLFLQHPGYFCSVPKQTSIHDYTINI